MYAPEASRLRPNSTNYPYSLESESTHRIPGNVHAISHLDYYSTTGSEKGTYSAVGRFTNPVSSGGYDDSSTMTLGVNRPLYRALPPPIHIGTDLHSSITSEELSPTALPSIRRGDVSPEVNISHIGNLHMGHPSDPKSALTVDSPILSDDSEPWSPVSRNNQGEGPRQRKARREKPRIALAPDQPPTTQGKPRARVYVACIQWYVVLNQSYI